MRIARVATASGARLVTAIPGGWRALDEAHGGEALDEAYDGESQREDSHRGGGEWADAEVRLLAPCRPRIVVGMSHNGAPGDRELPQQAFLKPARAVVGPGDPILLDPSLGALAVEGELGLVIGRPARRLRPETALDAVLGVTIVNDVTLVDQIALDHQLVQAKSADGGTPIGPWIDTEADWRDAAIRMRVDGEERAVASVADLAYDPVEVLCYLTRHLTLGPGDVVLCGAPATTVVVEPGSRVVVGIDGIGELANDVRLEPAAEEAA